MAIHRYWRLTGLATAGNAALELSEARIYEGGALADAAATLTATIAPASGAVSDLRDGVAGGVVSWPYASYGAPSFALVWDFGAGLGVDQAQLRLGSGSTQANFVLDLALQYSDDSTNWAIFDRLFNIVWPGASTQIYLPADRTQADWNFDKTVLLLRMDRDTGFQDASLSPKTITNYEFVQISTAVSVTGGASAYFPGSPSRVFIDDIAAFGTGDFCIEFLIRFTNATAIQFIFDARPTSTNGAYPTLYINGSAIEYYVSNNVRISGAHGLANNELAHGCVSRVSGVTRVFVKGAQKGSSWTDNTNYLASRLTLGISSYDGFNNPMTGYLDSMRIKAGEAIYSSAFTPPTFFPSRLISSDAQTTHQDRCTTTASGTERMLPAVALPDGAAHGHSRETSYFDAQFGGTGTVSGTVKEKALPDNTPLHRRVLLMDQRSQVVFREAWSDGVTGAYTFPGVKTGAPHTVLAYDYTGTYRAVIADNILATP